MRRQIVLYILCLFFIKTGLLFAGDGRLSIYNYHLNEYLNAVYKNDDGYDKGGLEKIYNVMRSPDGRVSKIPISLIEIIDDIQDYFGASTIEVISAYRSPSYNRNLKRSGRIVANDSLHMKGEAVDIHIDEITEENLRDYAVSLKKGGVGYYPAYNFVHIDTGDVKYWKEDEPEERKLIGTEANPNTAWKSVTDKNIYFKGERIKVNITNLSYETSPFVKNVWYEFFEKGEWGRHERIVKSSKRRIVREGGVIKFRWRPKDMPFGKYRLVFFTSDDFNIPPVISNEFYLKRK